MSQEKMSDSTSSANPIKSSPLHNPSTLSCAPSSTQTFDFPQSQFYQEKYMKTDLQRHCAFFDRDGDGVISLSDTFSALRALGFNLFNCIGGTLLIHLAMSYQTSPSWIPSPWMPIYLERINRCHHGSSTKAYDFVGNVVSFPAVENVFFHFDPSKQGGLNYWQLIWMIWNLRDSFDPFGWAMSIFWWTGLYLLAANPRSGILSYEVMMAQFNGSLFYLIEQGNKQKLVAPIPYKQQVQMDRAKTLICEALDADTIGLKELALKTYLEASVALLIEPKLALDQLIFEDDFDVRQEVTDEAKKCLELLGKCLTRTGELYFLMEQEQEHLIANEDSSPSMRRSSSNASTTPGSSPTRKAPKKISTRGCVNADLSQLRKEFEKASLAEIIARQKRQSSVSSNAIEIKPSTTATTTPASFSINLQMISDLLTARQDAISSFNEKLFSLFDSNSKDLSTRAEDEIWRKTLKLSISSSNGDLMQPIGPIVGLLSHPNHPISQISRDFVMRLKKLTAQADNFDKISKQISEEYHQFSFQMIKLLRHNYAEELEDDSLDLPLQISIEFFFFSHLPALATGIQEIFSKAYEEEDVKLLSQTNRLSWLNFDHEDALYTILNVPEKYQLAASKFESAIQELRLASSLKCPTLKALSGVKVCDLICSAVDEEESSSSTPLGSEDLVLLLSWIIIQSQIPNINSFFAIVSEFLPDELIRGQAGYVLATIQTAMDYIKSLN